MVVYIHAYQVGIRYLEDNTIIHEKINLSSFTQYFISNGVCAVAVPMLFLISGFLFFNNFDGTLSGYTKKIQRRFWSLLVPYLIWCTLGIGFLLICQLIPIMNSLLKDANFLPDIDKPVFLYNAGDYCNRLLFSPVPFQLWYIRDLMVFIIISPVIYWLLDQLAVLFLFSLACFWLLDLNYSLLHSKAALFFCLGAYIAKKHIYVYGRIADRYFVSMAIFWIGLVIMKSIAAFYIIIPIINVQSVIMVHILYKISEILGILVFWYSVDPKNRNDNSLFIKLTQFSFFIFAFHEPFQKVLIEIMRRLFGMDAYTLLVIYFFEPLIVVFFSLVVGYIMKRQLRKIYYIFTGGR